MSTQSKSGVGVCKRNVVGEESRSGAEIISALGRHLGHNDTFLCGPELVVEIDSVGGVVTPRSILSTTHPIQGLAEQTINLREPLVIAT